MYIKGTGEKREIRIWLKEVMKLLGFFFSDQLLEVISCFFLMHFGDPFCASPSAACEQLSEARS